MPVPRAKQGVPGMSYNWKGRDYDSKHTNLSIAELELCTKSGIGQNRVMVYGPASYPLDQPHT